MQIALTNKNISKHTLTILLMFGLLGLLFFSSMAIGSVAISPIDIAQVFAQKLGLISGIDEMKELVLINIRLPRLLLTISVGAALGISGAALQGLFRNPLVEPGIIGVSSGAALGAIFVIMFMGTMAPALLEISRTYLMPLFAFLGGGLATAFTLKLSKSEGKTQITYLILAGVAITSLAGAAIGLSIFYADDAQLRSYTFWTLGDLSSATWEKLNILFPLIGIACTGLITMSRSLNAIALGESEAFHSGVSVEKVKLLTVLFSAMAVGVSVAFTGIIGFVGLVVPHIIRISFTSDHTLVLPCSAIGGACLLLLADIFARTIVIPAELPIGVVTAVIGTPFFIYLLISSKKKKLI
ncbi:FecCD family ABC transporter permease [Chondrinema litorale]|uniref:FecCD family ABC transporter permease n=1 Tax=Chondrinema litorale TaxID=2994555 RepID=UPI00254274B8|nr:iron ABC transporter permease [Chondrinema litorale]UZR99463.1 iron ABC transporter permease [Chondrinema litorale]